MGLKTPFALNTAGRMQQFVREVIAAIGYFPRFCNNCGCCFKSKDRKTSYCSYECYRERDNIKVSYRMMNPEHRKKVLKYASEFRKSRPHLKFRHNAHKEIWRYLKGHRKPKWTKLWDNLPYNLPQLKAHLESQFNNENGFTWENYGEAWEIDHIIPQIMFDFQSYDCKAFRDCWALHNLRPLTAEQNRKKCANIEA